ncbi:MAG: type I-U CRISPR-associated protein Csb2 [Vicinamibacterales bacterium]
MPPLTIGWHYLTGYAVATDPSTRDRAEWPPHPGRLFMALAAAWFETAPSLVGSEDSSPERQESEEEGEALRWLETLGDPELRLPLREHVFERSAVTVYVPANDTAGPSSAPLQSASSITRSKQPRTFPRVWVGDDPCFMHWAAAEGLEQYRPALNRLCDKVTRIGHSSSLVRMWVDQETEAIGAADERWEPDDLLPEFQVRTVSTGTLTMLTDRFNESARQEHATLSEQIESVAAQKKALTGKGSKERKAVIDVELEALTKTRDSINAHPPLRPALGLWAGYRRADRAESNHERAHSSFDTDVLVLAHADGPELALASALAVTRALRDTVMSRGGVQPTPAWVSGHATTGEPLRTGDGHLAFIPLPFVGREHADGHLLGVGLVFPRTVDRRERGRVLGSLLLDETGQPRRVELRLGRLGEWTVAKRDWTETRTALQPETWTAHPTGADTWASVTPVVLNRFPKADRAKDLVAWYAEVAGIVAESCTRVGLPAPMSVDIDTTSWHRGSPRATCKRRALRGVGATGKGDASLGDGFPSFPPKGTNTPRPQVHVWLRFAAPVVGPMLLGAGRYMGYGLCKPWTDDRR